nr:histidine kinase [Helcococcus sueciensis]
MGLLMNSREEIKKSVVNRFGNEKNYLVVFKHNSLSKNILKILLSKLYYIFDNSRTFILVFDNKGIYEKEISNSTRTDFYLFPESEIENFEINNKTNKSIISFDHLGKNISYEVPMTGKIFKDNKENLAALVKNNWERI